MKKGRAKKKYSLTEKGKRVGELVEKIVEEENGNGHSE